MSYLDHTQQLSEIAQEYKRNAYYYKEERANYAEALNKLTGLIYVTGLHDDKASFENKLTKLLATPKAEEAKKWIEQLNISEANYKGWEMVCKANGAEISAIQSVIKYNLTGELNANIANKAQVDSLMLI
jgi:hypothetical protein